MSAHHSPAPWSLDGQFDAGVEVGVLDAEGNEILGLAPFDGEDLDEWGDTSIANAHLIAAAPELLQQLEALVIQIEHSHMCVPPGVRAALAKAKGEST